jgi:hypothetical protein
MEKLGILKIFRNPIFWSKFRNKCLCKVVIELHPQRDLWIDPPVSITM